MKEIDFNKPVHYAWVLSGDSPEGEEAGVKVILTGTLACRGPENSWP